MAVDEIRLPWAADPRAFRRLVAAIRRHRPAIVHTHLVHADFLGLTAGRICGVPVLASTKHGFNSFRERRAVRNGGSPRRPARRSAHRDLGRARPLPRRGRGFRRRRVRGRPLRDRGGPGAADVRSRPALPACSAWDGSCRSRGTMCCCVRSRRRAMPFPASSCNSPGRARWKTTSGAVPKSSASASRYGFLGLVSPIEPVLEAAGIVVVPSLGEGFGMVALEAMERGRAVIASDVGGLPEIVVDGETGLDRPPGRPRPAGRCHRRAGVRPAEGGGDGPGGERAGARRVPAGALHGADGGPLRGGARPGRGAVTPRRRSRSQARASGKAARSASRKSHGTR